MADQTTARSSTAGDSGGVDRALAGTRDLAVATEEILAALGRAGANSGEILDIVIERAVRLCRAHAGQLHLNEGDVYRLSRGSSLVPDAFRRYSLDHPIARDRRSLMGRVVADRTTPQIGDVLADPEYGRQDLQRLSGFRTLMCAPMILHDEVVGALSVWRLEVEPFDDQHVELLSAFAAQAAIVLRQVDLTTELESKVDQLETLRPVGQAVTETLDPDEVLSRILSGAVEIADADGGFVAAYDDADGSMEVRVLTGDQDDLLARLEAAIDDPETPNVFGRFGTAAIQGELLAIPDLAQETTDPVVDVLLADGWRSLVGIPLQREGALLGHLVVERSTPGGFAADTHDALLTLAAQSTAALVNARLFRELQTKSAELEVASRHKSEFLASMSHELRTPLNAVIGFSEVLLDRLFGELNERQDEYVRDIHNSGRHLLELLNEILDLSKVEAGQMTLEPTVFRVTDALEYAASLVRERAARHGIRLSVETAPDVGTISADELRFKQVVLNLASNAVKFTPDGGAVDIRAEVLAGELLVTVTDTGVGIPPEDRERIFESFQQGGRGVAREEGTGLGLTLSRRIVDLFGGRLWLESQVDVGSTFGFSIPMGTPSDAGDGKGQHPLLLLVDDDRASLDLVTAYLEGAPVRLVRAHDGEAALRCLATDRPAGVVLDIRLPKIDGWEVLSHLRADPSTAHVPVVIVSVVDERTRGLEEGANEYLTKPVSRDELVGALVRAGLPMTPLTGAGVEGAP